MTHFFKRTEFTFFRSYYESTMKLSDEQRLAIYDAIFKYSFEGDIVTLDSKEDETVNAILLLMKPTLEIGITKSNAEVEGSKGNCQSLINRKASKNESNNNHGRSHTEAQGEQSVSDPEASIGKIDSENSSIKVSRNSQCAEYSDNDLKQQGFDEFWNIYPRKVGKANAKKIWNRIKPDEELQTNIFASIKKQKKSSQWQRDNGQFIPNPSTWLNQGRWDDELPESVSNSNFLNYLQRDYPDDDGFYDKFICNDFQVCKKISLTGQ